MTRRQSHALIVAVWILIQLPFLSTAFRVDEPNIIRIAQRAAEAPGDPYGFYINWGGMQEEAFHILANPPLVPYWLAGWASLFGWSEIVLHASMLPFSVLALLSFAVIARELGTDSRIAMLLLACSPGFLLASQVVMPDIAMLGFFLAALACAMAYLRSGGAWLVPLGFLAGAFAPLSKYNGAFVGVLLALVWLFGRGRRAGLFVIAVGPALGLGLWSFASLMQYGRIHILTIAEFESAGIVNILSAMLGFFGFGLLPLIVALTSAPPPLSRRVLEAVTVIGGVMMGCGLHFLFGSNALASIYYGLSAAITFRIFVISSVVGWRGLREKEFASCLLVLWLAIGVWFQFGLLFASVRYLLPLLPAVILLVLHARLLSFDKPLFRWGLVASGVLALVVAVGDARTANIYRAFVDEVVVPMKPSISGRFFFDGHWGFQYYMEREGARALNYWRQPRWKRGDVIVIARNPFPSYQSLTPTRALDFDTREIVRSPRWPVRTIDCGAWANFYGPGVMQCKGPVLPFGFSTGAADAFAVMTVKPRSEIQSR